MELYEAVGIWKRHQKVFWVVLLGFLAVGIGWRLIQPMSYAADLALNVSRSGVQQTAEYRYDGFYRLQADERFADTVVQWLSVSRIEQDIYSQAGARPVRVAPFVFGKSLDAKRLSSQLITVRYRTESRDEAVRVARAISTRVNEETQKLNAENHEESWFLVLGDEPVVSDGRAGWGLVLVFSAAFGVFFGFWSVLFRHYFLSGSAKKK